MFGEKKYFVFMGINKSKLFLVDYIHDFLIEYLNIVRDDFRSFSIVRNCLFIGWFQGR